MEHLKRMLVPALLLTLPLAAAERRAFTIRDLYHLKGVQDLALSPDGSKLLFDVSTQHLMASTRATEIWELDLATGAARQLTFGPKSCYAPAWSKDGKTLTFLSDREGGQQLWAMAAAGGEARKVTAFQPGVNAPKLLPDGKSLVFESTVFPSAGADGAKNQELADKLANGPVQAHLADALFYRHWTQWQDFQYTHLFTAPFNGKVVDLTPGKRDYPADATTPMAQTYDVSPDGKEVCVVTNPDPVPARSTNQDLFLVSLDGKQAPQDITASNKAADVDPKFSPDGRYIAYRTQARPGFESDCFRLAVYDRTTHARRILTPPLTTGWTASSGPRTARRSGSRWRRRATGRSSGWTWPRAGSSASSTARRSANSR